MIVFAGLDKYVDVTQVPLIITSVKETGQKNPLEKLKIYVLNRCRDMIIK